MENYYKEKIYIFNLLYVHAIYYVETVENCNTFTFEISQHRFRPSPSLSHPFKARKIKKQKKQKKNRNKKDYGKKETFKE